MQRYNIPEVSEANVNGLKDFLVNHGGLDYFDEITAAYSTNYRTTTLTKNGTAIPIRESSSSYSLSVNWQAFPKYNNENVNRLRYGYTTDSAIVLVPQDNSAGAGRSGNVVHPYPIVICKTQNGYTCVFFPLDGYTGSGYATTRCYIIDDNGVLTSWNTIHSQNNYNAVNVLTTAPIPGMADVAKDVYYTIHRPFSDIEQPFMLDIGDVSYASFAYNTILIKTS